jgi:NitT/TauT family transport system permease protein
MEPDSRPRAAGVALAGEESLDDARRRKQLRALLEEHTRKIVFGLSFAAAVIVAWQIIVTAYDVRPTTLPSPLRIVEVIFSQHAVLLENAVPTTLETIGGFLLSVVLGGLLGLVMSWSRNARDALYPNVLFFQLIPKVAVAPLFMIWLGIGSSARLAIAVFIAFFPMVISTTAGFNAADPALLRLCKSLTASKRQVFFQVQLPLSLPFLFNGMKISMTLALIGVIVAEFITSERGLGYIILFAGAHLDTPLMMAAIVVLCLVGLLLYGAVAAGEGLIMRRFGT